MSETVPLKELLAYAKLAVEYFEAKLDFKLDDSIENNIKLAGMSPVIKTFRRLVLANFRYDSDLCEKLHYIRDLNSLPLNLFLSQNEKDFLSFAIYIKNENLLRYAILHGDAVKNHMQILLNTTDECVPRVIATYTGSAARNRILSSYLDAQQSSIFQYLRHNYIDVFIDFIESLCENSTHEPDTRTRLAQLKGYTGYFAMPNQTMFARKQLTILNHVMKAIYNKNDTYLLASLKDNTVIAIKNALERHANNPDKISNVIHSINEVILANISEKKYVIMVDILCEITSLYRISDETCARMASYLHGRTGKITAEKKKCLAEAFVECLGRADIASAKFYYDNFGSHRDFIRAAFTANRFISLCQKNKFPVIKYYCDLYFRNEKSLPFCRAIDLALDIPALDLVLTHVFDYYDHVFMNISLMDSKHVKTLRKDAGDLIFAYRSIRVNPKEKLMFDNYDTRVKSLKGVVALAGTRA